MSKTRAVSYDVRWRVKSSNTAWSTPKNFKAGAEIVLTGLNPGKTYETEARGIGALGSMSEWAAQPDVAVPATTKRLSQGNLAMVRVGGIGSAWTGFSISYTATTTSATISCTSGTLQDGALNPSYAASSIVVSGTASTTVTYYLYYDDPTGAGGTLALGATTTYSDLSANQGRIFVGSVDVAYPASGSGGGGGNPGGGGGCVCIDMWVLEGLLAGDTQIGDLVDGPVFDPLGLARRVVTMNDVTPQPCMRLVTESGCAVDASISTPMTLQDGSLRMFPDMLGELALVDDRGELRWERVVSLKPIGIRLVILLRVGDQCYFAGHEPDRRVATHNAFAQK